MTKKNGLMLVGLLVLGTVYVIWFTDWFRPKTVGIFHAVRESHFRRLKANEQPILKFGLSRPLQLTEIKVVPLAAFMTNAEILPLWHLVCSTGTPPVTEFAYGQGIHGMKPEVAGSRPALLESNVVYRLLLRAGSVRGEHDFELGGTDTNAPAGS
jgi:hypothetical protein